MENEKNTAQPDNTASRTALWRAIHVLDDAKPHIIEDLTGLALVNPEDGWRNRPDMHPEYTKRLRASIVARARYIEDLVVQHFSSGIEQYVLLGSGLDTFAQRRPDIASRMKVFEIDRPATQNWKKQRLTELGYGIPEYLHFVPVDFETSSWYEKLMESGFEQKKPTVVACTGVTLYLTHEANMDILNRFASFASGSVIAITFYLPLNLMDEEDRPLQLIAEKGAREAGTPFISFYSPEEIWTMAENAGLKKIRTISTKDMEQLYFAGRKDYLIPASGEVFLVATT